MLEAPRFLSGESPLQGRQLLFAELVANGHTLLAMITTASRSHWPSDHPVADLAGAGLRVPCVVRLKLFALENRLLDRLIGTLGPADREVISGRLAKMLALA